MTEKNRHEKGESCKEAGPITEKQHHLNSELKTQPGQPASSEKSSRAGILAAGEKITKTIKIFRLKKKLEWIKAHIMANNKPPQIHQIGNEEMKLQILLKELEMLKKFNMLGFDSDAINLLLGLYYMVEMINEDREVSSFFTNGTVPEENKAATLELLLHEWWEKLELLPSYKERTAIKYQHLGTKVVVEKLYSEKKFVNPLNDIIHEINEYIKRRDIHGLRKAVKKSELFCEEIKKMAGRPKRRRYTGPIKRDELKSEEKKIIKTNIRPEKR